MNIASMAEGGGGGKQGGLWAVLDGTEHKMKYIDCKAGLRLMRVRNPTGLVLTGALAFVVSRRLRAGGRHGERRRWGDQQF